MCSVIEQLIKYGTSYAVARLVVGRAEMREVEEIARAIFGDVANIARYADQTGARS
jgi:hypothetical protein